MNEERKQELQDCLKCLKHHGIQARAPFPEDDFVVFVIIPADGKDIEVSIREIEIESFAEDWNCTYNPTHEIF